MRIAIGARVETLLRRVTWFRAQRQTLGVSPGIG
jgi:hypothetical protein